MADGTTILNSIQYTYNDKNQLETISDNDSSYSYTYNDAGQMTSEDNSGTPDMPDVVMSSTYDGFGNRSSLSGSVADTTEFTNDYLYNAVNEMTEASQTGSAVSDKSAGFTYNALGQLTGVNAYASADDSSPVYSAAYGYNGANALTSLAYTDSSDASIEGYGYAYNANGQVETSSSNDGDIAYSYDHDNRLTGESGTGLPASESYSYDATGNQTQGSNATGTNNQLSTDGTYDYAYDADGNLITRTTIATGATENFAWDYRNRLTDVTYKTSGGTTTEHIHYIYDALNRRIGQEIDSTGDGTYDQTERYVYDGNSLVMTLDGSGAVTHTFLNGPNGQALADDAGGGTVSWMLADEQGSVRDVINSSGMVLDHIKYDGYGNILSQSNSSNQPRFLYAGMQLDPVTGLYFDNARYYDSSTGTFISRDPTGFGGGNVNLYGYVNNDPANLIDRTGLSPKSGGQGRNGGYQYSDSEDETSWVGNYINAFFNGSEDYGSTNDVTPSDQVRNWTTASRDVAYVSFGAAAAVGVGTAYATYLGAEAAGSFLGMVTTGGLAGAAGSGTTNLLSQTYGDQPFSGDSFYQSLNQGAGYGMALGALGYGINWYMQLPASVTPPAENSPSSPPVVNATENAATVTTPRGIAVQSLTPEATTLRDSVAEGQQIFRAGNFPESAGAEGQYWSTQSPLTPGYANSVGAANLGANTPDFILGGNVNPGAGFITRYAPSYGSNAGGALEIVTQPGGVQTQFFHMP